MRDAYRNCRFCRGSGCLACQQESERDYKAAFPDGPKPIASVNFDDTEGMAALSAVMSSAGLQSALTEADERAGKLLSGDTAVASILRGLGGDNIREAVAHIELNTIITEKLSAIGNRSEKNTSTQTQL